MLFTGSDYGVPPDKSMVEVSLLGPGYGYGEAVLIHLGDGNWIIVDSCRVPNLARALPLEYLANLGVDPSTAVRAVVASHWDDDHIRGFAQVVAACTQAAFVLSPAFIKSDFLAYAATADATVADQLSRGGRELTNSLIAVKGSSRTSAVRYSGPSKRIFGPADMSMSHGQPVELWTLSPSDQEHTNFLTSIAMEIAKVRETRRAPVKHSRNKLTTVVWLSVGGARVLLGGDLEEEGRLDTGWTAVLNATGKPTGKCDVFKIPHHGSVTGHLSAVWQKMLVPNCIAAAAPWSLAGKQLPTESDVDRIIQQTNYAFVSSTAMSARSPKRNAAVDKTIKAATSDLRSFEPRAGMVRLRRNATAAAGCWSLELFGAAAPLSDFHS